MWYFQSYLLLTAGILATFVFGAPSVTTLNATEWQLSNGDPSCLFNVTINSKGYAHDMTWNGNNIVGNATGGYSDTGGKITFNFTSGPTIIEQTDEYIHVAFDSYLATVHYILMNDLAGHYQYVINNNLGNQGEVRSLYRFDPLQFHSGRTNIKNDYLPTIQYIEVGYKVQDETWQRRNGSYITKYDFSCFVRDLDYHGVYGDNIGAFIIAPGKDYYIGDHLKQELMLHRESATDDVVLLHMYHGSHYNSEFGHVIPRGKMWGPWLLYINDGDLENAKARSKQESDAWPYKWLGDTNYQNRGNVNGKLVLSDGRDASGAAVFLGDENGYETNNQGQTYQYTTYADDQGHFTFENVRKEKDYRLIAWSNGGKISDVDNIYNETTVITFNNTRGQTKDLGTIDWIIPKREIEWRIGDFDKKTLGLKYGGVPLEHGLSDKTPANLIYSIGESKTEDWYFAQSAQGNWTVIFDQSTKTNQTATLTLSFAGYTSQNGYGLGKDSYTYPEVTPTGLNVSMNQFLVGTISSENATDGALYRSATVAGGYYATRFTVPSEYFLTDKANRLDLTLTQNHRWRGIIWDALKLEWN
ncbi:uncharacterized protein IL334_006439 [Kwoniella shivajii]|uniref:rhamnogalacturonan endolyase n=1 Tax=Kwoniella shivajii TaxID=564305 RepID=A0ABZ1D6B2_9TREE|nr:hypothetical protein IL334_006439 [Kwoniella shivajii]